MNKYCNAKRLKRTLDSYVMGQEKGTKYLCMAIANHLQNIEAQKLGYIGYNERFITDKHDGLKHEFNYNDLWEEAKDIYNMLLKIQKRS